MPIEIVNCSVLLTAEDVEEIERRVGMPLPNAFKNALLSTNGGNFFPSVVVSPSSGADSEPLRIPLVRLADWRPDDYPSRSGWRSGLGMLNAAVRMFKRRPIEGEPLLMFIEGGDGFDFFIRLDSHNDGAVIAIAEEGLWNEERNEFDPPEPITVAGSLEEFWDRLVPDPSFPWEQTVAPFDDAERGRVDAVRAFLENGGNVDVRSSEGMTPLMCAVDSPRMVDLLLQHGAAVNVVDKFGRSPLNHCIRRGAHESLYALMSAGANAGLIDHGGQSIWEVAKDFPAKMKILQHFSART